LSLVIEEYECNKKLEAMNMCDRKDIIEWFCSRGANRESMEKIEFTNLSHLIQILTADSERSARSLNMSEYSLKELCNSFFKNENTQNSYMPPPYAYPSGK
jgi:hypothetical protein